MSAATDHLTKAITDLTTEVDAVIGELSDLSNDTEDEATATAIDGLVERLKGAHSTATTAAQDVPGETPPPADPNAPTA